ncbi:MAG: hydrogenase 3 maturation endopeptidase HyCI [Candidatus Hydrogenedentota bacterium]
MKPQAALSPLKNQRRPGPAFWNALGKRAILVGIGNSVRGDDGAAPALIQKLDGQCDCTCINAESTPENYLGLIVRQRPDIVLFIDAFDMHLKPGEWRVFEGCDIAETSLHTHAISLGLLLQFLRKQTQAQILVLGIQPRRIAFGEGLSAEVETAVNAIAQAVCAAKASG